MEDVWDSHPRLYHLLCLASFECCSTIGNRHGYLVYCSLGRITLLMGDTAIISGVSVSSHTFGMDRNYPTFLQHSSITHAGPHVAALCRPLYAQKFEMVVHVHSFEIYWPSPRLGKHGPLRGLLCRTLASLGLAICRGLAMLPSTPFSFYSSSRQLLR